MADKSTCARAFSQMLHRVRQLDIDEVITHVGNLYYNKETILYFPEMLKNKLLKGYDTSEGLGNIQKYNKCEELNTKHYF